MDWNQLLAQMLPVVLGMLAPFITALTEKAASAGGATLPNGAKPAVNAAAGLGLASMAADPATAVIAGPLGAMLGNRIREAMKKKPRR